MTSDPEFAEVLACEHAVWRALMDGDIKAEDRALSPGFLGVYPDGYADKSALCQALENGPTVASFSVSEERFIQLGEGRVLLVYLAEYQQIGVDEAEKMYVSSLWQKEGQDWRNIFSQDTPVTGIAVP